MDVQLAYEQFEVLFTNPPCPAYAFADGANVRSFGGTSLTNTPPGVFCKAWDATAAGEQSASPQKRLVEWIRDPATEEVFFAYLSFSNRVVLRELCNAVETRGVKVRFVLDKGTDLAAANALLACKPPEGQADRAPALVLRGNTSRLQHVKLFLVNPSSPRMRIAFGSGNLSSGLTLHHENWNFVTLGEDTHFARAHRCLAEGLLDHGERIDRFSQFLADCRKRIPFPEETDIRLFVAPTEGKLATAALTDAVDGAGDVFVAAHRLSSSSLFKALDRGLKAASPTRVRLVADDDLFWSGRGVNFAKGNTRFEWYGLRGLFSSGLEARWMQTNSAMQFHHNKFVVAQKEGATTVFTGAGNFTNAAFESNFENHYVTRIPSVVTAYKNQSDNLWNNLATAKSDLPARFVEP